MTRIAFHTPALDVRGTCVSIYDYAHFNEVLLHNESLIVVPNTSTIENKNDTLAVTKFTNRFKVIFYHSHEHLEEIISDCDLIYFIKYGKNDGILSHKIKNIVHCVFDMSQPHGDVYAGISHAIAKKYNNTLFVPHMISLKPSETQANLRSELNIPDDAVVFSRYGGLDTFNLEICYRAIKRIVDDTTDRYFLFINTPIFYHHPRIIHLSKIVTDEDKNKFICTSDAHLECSNFGHSFGLAIGEYSVNNKPIICYNGWVWNRNHMDILGDKAIYFDNEDKFYDILKTFNPLDYKDKDNNCYREYTPEKVMIQFKTIFID
jgi:hypothetical protein